MRSIGEEIWSGDGEGLLRNSIQPLERHQIILRESVIEDAGAGTDNGLRRAASAAQPPGEADVIADHILGLITQAAAQYHVGAQLPVILDEAAEIHVVGRIISRATAHAVLACSTSGCPNLLRRRTIGESLNGDAIGIQRGEGECPVEALSRRGAFARLPESSAEAQCVLRCRDGRIVLQLETVLRIGVGTQRIPSARKGADHVEARRLIECVL